MIAARRKPVKPSVDVRSPARAPRGRRSAGEAKRTRERVLRTAERLFAQKGYNGTSLRELAKASRVRMFTIQHHFGSKQRLYEEILRRWDAEVEQLVSRILDETADTEKIVERVVGELFDHFVANRGRVALNARAVLGEGLARRLPSEHGWVRFMSTSMAKHRLGDAGLDLGLFLITMEGILHNHVLAARHYRHLFGHDVTDARVAARVKRHLQRLILSLLAGNGRSS